MTPEQFIFWLSGYFTAAKDNGLVQIDDIKEALNKVKTDHSLAYYGVINN